LLSATVPNAKEFADWVAKVCLHFPPVFCYYLAFGSS
jgi:superfamily II RNA helicase